MTPEALRALARMRLDPLDAPMGAPLRSDFDLNPDFRPAAGRELRDAAVLTPIIRRPEGLTVLLTRRADGLNRHAGQIAFPGGRLDPGEGPVEAALREAFEEVGLSPEFVEPLGLSSLYETGTGYRITPVVALVRPGFDIEPNAEEVAEVFEAPFELLMDRASHRREFYDLDGRRRFFYAVYWGDRRIWGATAGMLHALSERLFEQPRAAGTRQAPA